MWGGEAGHTDRRIRCLPLTTALTNRNALRPHRNGGGAVTVLWLIYSRVPTCRCLDGLRVTWSFVQARGDGGTASWSVPGLKRGRYKIGYERLLIPRPAERSRNLLLFLHCLSGLGWLADLARCLHMHLWCMSSRPVVPIPGRIG